ncbi:MAG: hypothetical protein ACRESJ_20535 [Pseudomonas sp.]|uniref:hypothetical protein n=1 Tax=Pseudomonas sp. TaxID=306 RepID=UPI003D6EFE0D
MGKGYEVCNIEGHSQVPTRMNGWDIPGAASTSGQPPMQGQWGDIHELSKCMARAIRRSNSWPPDRTDKVEEGRSAGDSRSVFREDLRAEEIETGQIIIRFAFSTLSLLIVNPLNLALSRKNSALSEKKIQKKKENAH